MKTLIYVGANFGQSLLKLLNEKNFDIVYAFEPNPEVFEALKLNLLNYPKVELINAACFDETGKKPFYVTENIASSSLSDVNMENQSTVGWHSGGLPAKYKIEVDCINLREFLEEKNINEIDLLVTDCQGSDYKILLTLKDLIENKKIKEIFCETHADGVEMYIGLNNYFSNFKNLLGDNFEIQYYSLDGNIISKEYYPSSLEWDTCWKLK